MGYNLHSEGEMAETTLEDLAITETTLEDIAIAETTLEDVVV